MKEIVITKAEKILRFIESAGEEGRGIYEILGFVVFQNTGKKLELEELREIRHLYTKKVYGLLHTFARLEYMTDKYTIISPIAPPFYPPDSLKRNLNKLWLIRKQNSIKRKFDAFDTL